MNPDTNKFVPLYGNVEDLKKTNIEQKKFLESIEKAKQTFIQDAQALVTPEGNPVPDSWSIFTVGEEIVIKNYTFKVAHIGETYLVLEPVGIVEIGKEK